MPKNITNQIDKNNIPQHVAIILDGNGRWAKEKGLERIYGHQAGTEAVRRALTAAAKMGISYLTLYTFSTENWNRPQQEVNALMSLLVSSLRNELDNLMEKRVRLNIIGNIADLPDDCQKGLQEAIQATAANTGITLTLAISYSGRWEIVQAAKQLVRQIQSKQISEQEINEETFMKALNTFPIPDPDILIRTGGEYRISNFLLWQMAYTDMFFLPIMWPEFDGQHLHEIICQFQARERRFGKTSEQVQPC
jgi:undecaprenyl diphosphate synthase